MNKRAALGYLIWGLAAGALLLEAPAPAQSLGEVARQQRVQKGSQARSTRVYTEDNLPRTDGLTTTAAEVKSPAPKVENTVGESLAPFLPSPEAEVKGPAPNVEKTVGESLAPFVPSPEVVVEEMLRMALVGRGDIVYDLGCGDGRILITAAQKFGAHAVGVELDDDLYKRTSERIKELELEDRVQVIHGDLMEVNLTPATVVTLYLLPSANEKLRPNMEKYLQPGARVVSHDFEVPGWQPSKVETVTENESRLHRLYLYRR